MSAFNNNYKDADYPIINVEAENKHFEASDLVISWIEGYKSLQQLDDNSDIDTQQLEAANTEFLRQILPSSSSSSYHSLSAFGLSWNVVKIFSEKQGALNIPSLIPTDRLDVETRQDIYTEGSQSPEAKLPNQIFCNQLCNQDDEVEGQDSKPCIQMRGTGEWAPPRPQVIFNIHEETNLRRLMERQNYRCAGCGTKIDVQLARRFLYCHYLGKYFCKCCFSHKAIYIPGYILHKWDFHKYAVSHFALQLLDRISNEPLFNINAINPSLYRKVKRLRQLIDIRMQLYYLKIYISTCVQTDKLSSEYATFSHQHLLGDDVHTYSLNNLIEIQHGKLYEYLGDLVSRSIAHIAQCDRCRAKGHYCQLCGPSSLVSSMILNNCSQSGDIPKDGGQIKLKQSSSGQNISASNLNHQFSKTLEYPASANRPGNHSRSSSGNYSNFTISTNLSASGTSTTGSATVNVNDHELIFPFEIGRVAQCKECGCCFHLQCFLEAGQNCPKCERVQRRKAEMSSFGTKDSPSTVLAAS